MASQAVVLNAAIQPLDIQPLPVMRFCGVVGVWLNVLGMRGTAV